MNSFTRIGLPILLVVGLVFGITFVRMYSPDDSTPEGPKAAGSGKAAQAKVLPVRFGLTTASAQPDTLPPGLETLKYWDSVVEVGQGGHFEFWCHNRNAQPVTVRVSSVNCQCAGVEVTAVHKDAFRDYAVASALAGGPLGAIAAGPVAAIAHAELNGRLEWAPLLKGNDKFEQTIPAADPADGTRAAIVRLGWEGKGESGPKVVTAELVARLGDAPGTNYHLETQSTAVPAFDAVRADGPAAFAPARETPVGELRENSEVRRTVYLVSATRRQLLYTVTAARPDPCITWSEPVLASPAEVQALVDFPKDGPPRRPRSVYKV
jgi:hypothetical protein